MIIFTHIPKCGGKSLRQALFDAYGKDKVLLHYNDPDKKHRKYSFLPNTLIQQYRKLRKHSVPSNYDVVYGHFCLNDFSRQLEGFNVKSAAFFRDPVEWVGSYVMYSAQKENNSDEAIDFIIEIKKRRLAFGYRMFLGNFLPEDIDYVGIVESYDQSLGLFENMFHKKLDAPFLNKTKNAPQSYRDFFIRQGIIKEVEALMENNMSIYQKALTRFQELNIIYP